MFKNNMRLRIMSHYAVSFFAVCLMLVAINVLYMSSFVYRDDALYRFEPDALFKALDAGVQISEDQNSKGEITLDPEVAKTLIDATVGLQIIDKNLHQVYRQALTGDFPVVYTPSQLVALYETDAHPGQTVFVAPLKASGQAAIPGQAAISELTAILVFDSAKVKRTNYTYDVNRFKQAYNIYWLIAMNLLIVLMFSYLYTYSISRPVHRLITRVIGLSKGSFGPAAETKGIYREVEVALNHLGETLHQAVQAEAKAQSTREAWIANLSHDIKTPLTSMMGYGEIIGDTQYPLTDQQRQHYGAVLRDKGQYIQGLIADLNLATRLRHHAQLLRLEKVELVGLMKEILIAYLNDPAHNTLDNTEAVDTTADNTLAFTHAQEQIWCTLDQHLFKRVIYNLLANAWQHNPGGTRVCVHVEVYEAHEPPRGLGALEAPGALGSLETGESGHLEQVRVTIEDNGVGVGEEELQEIFTRYYRGTHTEAVSEGSGLGLAIARDIVEAHGGKIFAARGEAGGLRVTILLKAEGLENTLKEDDKI